MTGKAGKYRDNPVIEGNIAALSAFYDCFGNLCAQVGVFRVTLLIASQPGIPVWFDYKRAEAVDADAPCFQGRGGIDLSDQLAVPGAADCEPLGKHRRSGNHDTVRSLLDAYNWDFQPGVFDGGLLQLVKAARLLRCSLRAGVSQTEKTARRPDALIQRPCRKLAAPFEAIFEDFSTRPGDRHIELTDLLGQCHPPDQIVKPFFERLRGIEICRPRCWFGGFFHAISFRLIFSDRAVVFKSPEPRLRAALEYIIG